MCITDKYSRIERNRVSAQRSRDKKFARITALENELQIRERDCAALSAALLAASSADGMALHTTHNARTQPPSPSRTSRPASVKIADDERATQTALRRARRAAILRAKRSPRPTAAPSSPSHSSDHSTRSLHTSASEEDDDDEEENDCSLHGRNVLLSSAERRKIKNRISAERSRRRVSERTVALEIAVAAAAQRQTMLAAALEFARSSSQGALSPGEQLYSYSPQTHTEHTQPVALSPWEMEESLALADCVCDSASDSLWFDDLCGTSWDVQSLASIVW